MYDPEAQMYTVVAEIKREEMLTRGGGLEQNVEQMLGLFVDRQTLMLGLVVQNLKVRPLLLQLADGVLTFTDMQVLSLRPADITRSLTLLMKVLIGVNFVSGPCMAAECNTSLSGNTNVTSERVTL